MGITLLGLPHGLTEKHKPPVGFEGMVQWHPDCAKFERIATMEVIDQKKKPGTAFPQNPPPGGSIYKAPDPSSAQGVPNAQSTQADPLKAGNWWSPSYARAANNSDLTGLDLERMRTAQGASDATLAGDPVKRLVTTGSLSTGEKPNSLPTPSQSASTPSPITSTTTSSRTLTDDPRLVNADPSRQSLGASRDFSKELGAIPGTLPGDMRQGVVYKTDPAKGSQSKAVYSGMNVGPNAQFTNGLGIGFQPGGVVSTVGGMSKQEIEKTLTNPNGTRWTANDNAIMAANLRDGVSPYRGTSAAAGQSQVFIPPSEASYGAMDLLSPNRLAARERSMDMQPKSGESPASYGARLQAMGEQDRIASAAADRQQQYGFNQQKLEVERQRLANEAANRSYGFSLDERKLDDAEANTSLNRQKTGVEMASLQQLNELRSQFVAEKDPAKQMAIARQINTLTGKESRPDEYTMTRTNEGQIAKMNKRTGQVEFVNPQPVTPIPKEGDALIGPDGRQYVVKNGRPVLAG